MLCVTGVARHLEYMDLLRGIGQKHANIHITNFDGFDTRSYQLYILYVATQLYSYTPSTRSEPKKESLYNAYLHDIALSE